MLLAEDIDAANSETRSDSIPHHPRGRSPPARHFGGIPSPPEMSQVRVSGGTDGHGEDLSAIDSGNPTAHRAGALGFHRRTTSGTSDAGNRRKVARALTSLSNVFGTASADRFDDSEFKRGPALDFPEIPGEQNRNRDLSQIREQYNIRGDGVSTPGRRSRASSCNPVSGENTTAPPLASHNSDSFFLSPPSSAARPLLQVTTAEPGRGTSPTERRLPPGADRLAVPSPVHLGPPATSPASPNTPVMKIPGSPSSPAVVVSFDHVSSFSLAGAAAGPSSPPTSPA